MYIYNETINIDESVHNEWLLWNGNQIQKVLATGCFLNAKMTQVLIKEELGGVTYSIQYTAETEDKIKEFKASYEPKFQQEALQKFADKMLSFKTELRIIQEWFV